MYILDDIKVIMREDTKGNTLIVLLEPITVNDVSVPKGFASDGASIPRFAWRIIGHPKNNSGLGRSYRLVLVPIFGRRRLPLRQSKILNSLPV